MKLKMLNGAPLSQHLDFGPQTLLSSEAANQYMFGEVHRSPDHGGSAPRPKWRLLARKGARLHSGWSQPYLPAGATHGSNLHLSFFVPDVESPTDLPPEDTTILDSMILDSMGTFQDHSIEADHFVQHSLILHDNLLSSQIAADEAADRTVSSSSFLGASFESMSTDIETQDEDSQVPIVQVPSTMTLTSLISLPSPGHLRSIYPQTPTPNFLCVLIAAPAEREVFVKKGSFKMSLREILVADDTKSGFKISFWIRPSKRGDLQNNPVQALDRVNVGDILLLRNIALNAFRDNVYGQSLNPSITRVRTTVEILMSSRGISSRQLDALPAAVVAKFMRVKRWASAHVAPDTAGSKKRKGTLEASSSSMKRSLRSSKMCDDSLPPDSMEGV